MKMYGARKMKNQNGDQYISFSTLLPMNVLMLTRIKRDIDTTVRGYYSTRIKRTTKAINHLRAIRFCLSTNNCIDVPIQKTIEEYLSRPSKSFLGLFFESGTKRVLRSIMKDLNRVKGYTVN